MKFKDRIAIFVHDEEKSNDQYDFFEVFPVNNVKGCSKGGCWMYISDEKVQNLLAWITLSPTILIAYALYTSRSIIRMEPRIEFLHKDACFFRLFVKIYYNTADNIKNGIEYLLDNRVHLKDIASCRSLNELNSLLESNNIKNVMTTSHLDSHTANTFSKSITIDLSGILQALLDRLQSIYPESVDNEDFNPVINEIDKKYSHIDAPVIINSCLINTLIGLSNKKFYIPSHHIWITTYKISKENMCKIFHNENHAFPRENEFVSFINNSLAKFYKLEETRFLPFNFFHHCFLLEDGDDIVFVMLSLIGGLIHPELTVRYANGNVARIDPLQYDETKAENALNKIDFLIELSRLSSGKPFITHFKKAHLIKDDCIRAVYEGYVLMTDTSEDGKKMADEIISQSFITKTDENKSIIDVITPDNIINNESWRIFYTTKSHFKRGAPCAWGSFINDEDEENIKKIEETLEAIFVNKKASFLSRLKYLLFNVPVFENSKKYLLWTYPGLNTTISYFIYEYPD